LAKKRNRVGSRKTRTSHRFNKKKNKQEKNRRDADRQHRCQQSTGDEKKQAGNHTPSKQWFMGGKKQTVASLAQARVWGGEPQLLKSSENLQRPFISLGKKRGIVLKKLVAEKRKHIKRGKIKVSSVSHSSSRKAAEKRETEPIQDDGWHIPLKGVAITTKSQGQQRRCTKTAGTLA